MDWLTLISNGLSRLPLERWLMRPRDGAKSLENFVSTLPKSESIERPPESKEVSQSPPESAKSEPSEETAGTACIPCSINHLSTCSGLLSEAMRFAREDGIDNREVITRIGLCQDELNAMIREDLRPEKVAVLGSQDKQLANKILVSGRDLGHELENLSSVDDLETISAKAQSLRTEVGQSWLQRRLSKMSRQQKQAVVEKTLEKLEA